METSGLPGGVFSGIGSGILGLEMPLPPPRQQPQNPQTVQHPHGFLQHPQMVAYSSNHENEKQLKPGYTFGSKTGQTSAVSDDDEPAGFTLDDGGGKRKDSPWQRMKWTDGMVRLLIMAVHYIGDEAGPEGGATDPSGKKKGVGGGLLQKKGKWKSVSRAMMEKGFYVSPQQCEDKFNDLNKRYKRVNDILGRGTACKVVENQTLLDSMDLSPKMKEQVRKLLNSKHLFFREMCAYHHSCGHASSANHSPDETSQIQHQQAKNARICGDSESKSAKVVGSEEDDDDDEDEEDDVDEDDDDEEAMDEENDEESLSPSMQQLSSEVVKVIEDGSKSGWEKKQWMKKRAMQLEERRVRYQNRALKLESQRLKWVRFSGKKGREMEKAKLDNQRRLIENERLALILRHKEMELSEMVDIQPYHHHSPNKRGDPSSITG
ncbi:F-box protein PP2-A15-like [Hibiscus syriacus]|uniref:F-box protein PP2-A15-like n=1 Tax=Hibiscus syriacus TaxID=106335 RepID=A0A6A3CNM9_HIBSY|nr:MATH and LRR domain-containing protein PFE0570w-like [Hibiscus syriacus]KAE8731085.1 F-box protein PP2-A15-like [Hibiscus syriacus]